MMSDASSSEPLRSAFIDIGIANTLSQDRMDQETRSAGTHGHW